MKKLLQTLLLLPLFVLGACNGGGDSGDGPPSPTGATKPVNSYWSMTGNSYGGGFVDLDLSQLSLNTPFHILGSCSSYVTFKGNAFGGIFKETSYSGSCDGLTSSDVIDGVYGIDENNQLIIILTELNNVYFTNQLEMYFR